MIDLMRGTQVLAVILACGWLMATAAYAAPDRLNDDVPSAFPDQEGAMSFSFGHQSLDLDGALANLTTEHEYVKLGYMLNPHTSLRFRYGNYALGGEYGLISPLFDNVDSANSYSFDLNLNMLNQPATPSDEENGVAFIAGSAFGMGVNATHYQMTAADLDQSNSLISVYLVYTTDLTEQMRAHTYFSSGRISGDTTTGSVNRIAAGMDYTLVPGKRELKLMANGILDVYNFRQPSFNTNRISRFDLGMRYRFDENWFATLGYATANDSENDASGGGVYANINFVDMPPFEPEEDCEVVEEEVPADAPPEQAALPGTPGTGNGEPPLMMATLPQANPVPSQAPQPDATRAASAAQDELPASDGVEIPTELDQLFEDEESQAEPPVETVATLLAPSGAGEIADDNMLADSIEVPTFPENVPRHTAADAHMIRPGLLLAGVPPGPLATPAGAVMLRPPFGPHLTGYEPVEEELLELVIAANADTPQLQGIEIGEFDYYD